MLNKIDHIVLAVPELQSGITYLEKLTGAPCSPGGKHPDFGTHNALLKIGKDQYLEVIAADPDNPKEEKLWMGLSHIKEPRITRLAIKSNDMLSDSLWLKKMATELGTIKAGRRQRPNGSWLSWKLTLPQPDPVIETIPFLINWGKSEHPANGLKGSCSLSNIALFTPQVNPLQRLIDQLNIQLNVLPADENKIQITLKTPQGFIILD